MEQYILDFQIAKDVKMDIRDCLSVSWKDVVVAALETIKKNATLEEIYDEIEGHKKAENNAHWREKVRQTLQYLQKSGKAVNVSRGVWAMAA